jgi:hypothetical protein
MRRPCAASSCEQQSKWYGALPPARAGLPASHDRRWMSSNMANKCIHGLQFVISCDIYPPNEGVN